MVKRSIDTFVAERLTEARIARGMFKNALADAAGVSRVKVGEYENGKAKPSLPTLEALAGVLGFPMEFFMRPPFALGNERVYWRSRTAESKAAREMARQRVRWAAEMQAILNLDLSFTHFRLPKLQTPTDFRFITQEVIEEAAEAMRDGWGLGRGPIPDMILALENAGIVVVQLDIPSDRQDGLLLVSDHQLAPVVGINAARVSAARIRFDAAHELGHLVLHQHVTEKERNNSSYHKIIETQAHRFAGALLFPREEFMKEAYIISLDHFLGLKKKWGIAISAMIERAYSLDMIDEEWRTRLYQALSKRRWRKIEPYDSPEEMPLERPRMLRRAVEEIISGGVFSRDQLLREFALPASEAEELCALRPGYFSEAESRQADVVVELRPSLRRDCASEAGADGEIVEFPR